MGPPVALNPTPRSRRWDLNFGRPHSTVSRLNALKKTPLHTRHRVLGARMVEFGGWDMPVEYSGIMQEHIAVRTSAGLFDVSHMGQIEVRGPQALALLQYVTSNDVAKLHVGQAQYSAIMHPQGSAVDDCLVHRLG